MKKYLFILIITLFGFVGHTNAQLPAITLKTMEGKTVRTDTISNNGKPFIIDFFATWCKPCNRELDAINEVYEDWQEETGVKIYAISVDNHGWTYDVILDTNMEFQKALGIQMIPYVLIVDGSGKIVYRHNGYTEGAEQELIEKVRELVQ